MIERLGTWEEVTVGTVVLSPTKEPLLVIKGPVRGYFRLKDRGGHEATTGPHPRDRKVMVLEATPEEAAFVAQTKLGAEILVDQEREKRMAERAKRWIVPAFPAKGQRDALTRARDHVTFYHGTYAGSNENGGFKTLVQITKAHEEMHDPDAVGGLFMDLPHTHRGSGGREA